MQVSEIIKSFGLSVEGFADRIGMSHHQAHLLASGETRPDRLTQYAIAGLGATLLDETDPDDAMAAPTGYLAESLAGDTWAKLTARVLLPVVVEHLEENGPMTLTYAEAYARAVARGAPEQIGTLSKMAYPCGAVAESMAHASEALGIKVPPFTAIIVGKKTGLPGDDIDHFLEQYLTRKADRNALKDPERRRRVIEGIWQDIYDFDRWRAVVSAVGLRFDAGYGDPVE
jgi:transcriptional regulator with XRE-family HTH domain